MCESALMVFRVFYEATRNLDSQPPPRTDHVEACRPRGLCLFTRDCRGRRGPSATSSSERLHRTTRRPCPLQVNVRAESAANTSELGHDPVASASRAQPKTSIRPPGSRTAGVPHLTLDGIDQSLDPPAGAGVSASALPMAPTAPAPFEFTQPEPSAAPPFEPKRRTRSGAESAASSPRSSRSPRSSSRSCCCCRS